MAYRKWGRDDLEELIEEEEENEEEDEEEDEDDAVSGLDDDDDDTDDDDDASTKERQEEFDRMRKALAKANKEAKQRRLQLKELEREGLTVDEAIALKKKSAEDEHKRALKRGDVDKIREQLDQKYQRQVKELEEKNEKMQKSLYDYLVSSKASDALSQLGAKKGAAKVLTPHVQKYANVTEEDGKFVVRVLDDDGDVRINDDGDYFGIPDLINEMKSDEVFGNLFVQAQASGGGSKPGASSGKGTKGTGPTKPKAEMSTEEKAQYVRKFGYGDRKVQGKPCFAELD